MTIALVGQAGIAGANATSPQTITYASTGGNALFIAAYFYNSSAIPLPTAISDTGGNTWSFSSAVAQNPPTNTNTPDGSNHITTWIGWALNAAAVASVTISRSDTASNWWRITVAEFSGVGGFDNSWSGTSVSAATWAAGPVQVNQAGSLVLASVADYNGNSEPAPFISFTSSNAINCYAINPATGAFSPTWSGNSAGIWSGAMAVFTPGGIQSGAAGLTAPGGLAVSATLTVPGIANLSSVPSLATSAVVARQAAAALAAGASIAPAALVTAQAQAALSAAGTMTVSAGDTREGAAALAASPALAVAGTVGPLVSGSATLSADPAFTVTAGQNQAGSAGLAAAPSLFALARVRPEGLWAIYVAAAEAAAAEAQRWRMYRSLVGGSSQSGFAYGTAFEAENAADQAYQNWQAAYRAEFPGAAG